MTTNPTKRRQRISTESVPMLRWVLRRDIDVLTCEVDARSGCRWDVCVVPHCDVAASIIERIDAPLPALERHAEVASRLRETGWAVVDHVPIDRAQARPGGCHAAA